MLFKYLLAIFFVLNLNSLNAQEDSLQSKITKNLRCLICQGQSVYDSQSDFAMSMKLLIKNKIEDGESKDQIYDYLKNQYGEWNS